MSKLLVMYSRPTDPAYFVKHVREVHMPLLDKLPGLREYTFGPAMSLDSKDDGFFWIFVGTYDSSAAIDVAFASAEGKAVMADIPNFSELPPTMIRLDVTEH